MGKRIEFVVSLEQPEGSTVADLKAYVEDAVGCWSGQLRPPGTPTAAPGRSRRSSKMVLDLIQEDEPLLITILNGNISLPNLRERLAEDLKLVEVLERVLKP